MYAYLYTFIFPNIACSICISLLICSFYFIILCFKWGSESTGKSKQNRQINCKKQCRVGDREERVDVRGVKAEHDQIHYMKFVGNFQKIILLKIKIK